MVPNCTYKPLMSPLKCLQVQLHLATMNLQVGFRGHPLRSLMVYSSRSMVERRRLASSMALGEKNRQLQTKGALVTETSSSWSPNGNSLEPSGDQNTAKDHPLAA